MNRIRHSGPRPFGLGLLIGMAMLLLACGRAEPDAGPGAPRYVTTIPPFEMILERVVAGRAEVTRLLEPGASPHTYDPTPSALRATSGGTALVYGDEHLDGWAAELPARRRLALLDLLPPGARLAFDDPSATVDPHFWTDPLAVRQLLPALADTLCAFDRAGCSTYRANADSFATALSALDARIAAATAPVREARVLLAQPFFRYFLRRYGPQSAGVVEPRPGAAPTARQLRRIVDRARATGARAVLTQQSLSDRAARAVAEASGVALVRLDPLGGVEGRRTYEALLLHNAQTLHDALRAPPRPD
jgi:zinc transport system substrate-binding protein